VALQDTRAPVPVSRWTSTPRRHPGVDQRWPRRCAPGGHQGRRQAHCGGWRWPVRPGRCPLDTARAPPRPPAPHGDTHNGHCHHIVNSDRNKGPLPVTSKRRRVWDIDSVSGQYEVGGSRAGSDGANCTPTSAYAQRTGVCAHTHTHTHSHTPMHMSHLHVRLQGAGSRTWEFTGGFLLEMEKAGAVARSLVCCRPTDSRAR
jgi:hypothetical protein